MKTYSIIYPVILALLIFLPFSGGTEAFAAREKIKTICVLPFRINAAEELTHVREGILHMLYSRLSWRDNVVVVPENTVKNLLTNMKNESKKNEMHDIAGVTHSNFVLTGTLTELGGSFSIDVQVFDIENKRYMAFFEQSKKDDALIAKVSRIAAAINQKVFNRSTQTWEKMEEEKQAYIKELKRRNPEYMMQNHQWQDAAESPGWKIWKYLF